MKIYSMTATFGKLEHETLTLKPGLNVIHAPNEWGKSTWCAFLLAMLYGIETKAKSGKTGLADKEHFAPWSGSPMSGRMDIQWEGRDITIERSTKGRIPMGVFRAYETASGLDVPELTAQNCGQMLLGVEQSVFRRTGFIRLTDLPVTQDDALRRRLNALVSTGDESGDGPQLEKGLRELKNKCRYNKTGLIPEAEEERDALEDKLFELDVLTREQEKLQSRLEETAANMAALRNHAAALTYDAAILDAQRVSEAEEEWDAARKNQEALENRCASLPGIDLAREQCSRIQVLMAEIRHLNFSRQNMQNPPVQPAVPKPFLGMDPDQAREQVYQDEKAFRRVSPALWILLLVLSAVSLAAGGWLGWTKMIVPAAGCCVGTVVLVIAALMLRERGENIRRAICRRYGSEDMSDWEAQAEAYADAAASYRQEEAAYRAERSRLEAAAQVLRQKHVTLCGDASPDQAMQYWQSVVDARTQLDAATRETERAHRQYMVLQSMARPIPEPAAEDSLTWSAEQTQILLQEQAGQYSRLERQLSECIGRKKTLGDAGMIRARLTQVNSRLNRLNDTAAALTLAQETYAAASDALQRRFAPGITRRAQEILKRMTDGRYDRLAIGKDFQVSAAAAQEDTLHDALWRSEGTVDQLYLALRLAVAEELSAECPLILDDALVRFDDARARLAMEILAELSKSRQILLFSCHTREASFLPGKTAEA